MDNELTQVNVDRTYLLTAATMELQRACNAFANQNLFDLIMVDVGRYIDGKEDSVLTDLYRRFIIESYARSLNKLTLWQNKSKPLTFARVHVRRHLLDVGDRWLEHDSLPPSLYDDL